MGLNTYGQKSRLDVFNGICIVDTGFGGQSGLQIHYGFASATQNAPLGLNLAGYTAFQLKFAGVSATDPLYVTIVVWLHNGTITAQELPIPISEGPEQVSFPFSNFSSPSNFSDIDYIGI